MYHEIRPVCQYKALRIAVETSRFRSMTNGQNVKSPGFVSRAIDGLIEIDTEYLATVRYPNTRQILTKRVDAIGRLHVVSRDHLFRLLVLTTDINVTPPGYPPAGRLAIADVARSHIQDLIWEILQPDGTPIGTIMASGFARGVPPPGAPPEQTLDNLTITGGTGAFLGVRGQGGLIDVGHPRQASVAEAPAERRTLGGAKRSYILKLLWPVLED